MQIHRPCGPFGSVLALAMGVADSFAAPVGDQGGLRPIHDQRANYPLRESLRITLEMVYKTAPKLRGCLLL